jgi:hypothetical protein
VSLAGRNGSGWDGIVRDGWLHRTTARSAVGAARPLGQPVHLSAIEPALRELGTDSNRSGMGRATSGRARIL